MPKKLESQLKRRASKMGLGEKRSAAYVYGTLRKTGWKPRREKNKELTIKARRGGRVGFAMWTRQMRSAAARKAAATRLSRYGKAVLGIAKRAGSGAVRHGREFGSGLVRGAAVGASTGAITAGLRSAPRGVRIAGTIATTVGSIAAGKKLLGIAPTTAKKIGYGVGTLIGGALGRKYAPTIVRLGRGGIAKVAGGLTRAKVSMFRPKMPKVGQTVRGAGFTMRTTALGGMARGKKFSPQTVEGLRQAFRTGRWLRTPAGQRGAAPPLYSKFYKRYTGNKEIRGKAKLVVADQIKGNNMRDAYGRMAKKKKKMKMPMSHGMMSEAEHQKMMSKELSLEEKAREIRDGLYAALETYRKQTYPSGEKYCYLNEVYDDHVIIGEDGKYYKAAWGKDKDNGYWLADKEDWIEVKRSWEEVGGKEIKMPIYAEKAAFRGGRGRRGFALWTREMRSAAAKKGWAGRARAVGAAAKSRFMAGRNKIVSGAKLVGAARRVGAAGKLGLAGAGRGFSGFMRGTLGAGKYRPFGGSKAHTTGYKIGRAFGAPGRALKSKPVRFAASLAKTGLRRTPVGLAARFAKFGATRTARYVKAGARTVGRGISAPARYLVSAYKKKYAKFREIETPAGLMVFKDRDDNYRWLMLSSNAFRDRDGEIVSKKGLERDLAQWHLEGEPKQPFRAWHIPLSDDYAKGLELGECDFRMLHGRTLIESGSFLTKEIGEAVYNNQDKLAGSIGFRHAPTEPNAEGVFTNFRIFERSLLPKERASNALTTLYVV